MCILIFRYYNILILLYYCIIVLLNYCIIVFLYSYIQIFLYSYIQIFLYSHLHELIEPLYTTINSLNLNPQQETFVHPNEALQHELAVPLHEQDFLRAHPQ